jgi:hypothetical protein
MSGSRDGTSAAGEEPTVFAMTGELDDAGETGATDGGGETDASDADDGIDEIEASEQVRPTDTDGRPSGSRHVSIEICDPPARDSAPQLNDGTRVDTMVKDRLLPTARLDDGRYVAWWFDTDAPDPYDETTTEWVVAPTRFLAAATFRELTEDPARFDELLDGDAADGTT